MCLPHHFTDPQTSSKLSWIKFVQCSLHCSWFRFSKQAWLLMELANVWPDQKTSPCRYNLRTNSSANDMAASIWLLNLKPIIWCTVLGCRTAEGSYHLGIMHVRHLVMWILNIISFIDSKNPYSLIAAETICTYNGYYRNTHESLLMVVHGGKAIDIGQATVKSRAHTLSPWD